MQTTQIQIKLQILKFQEKLYDHYVVYKCFNFTPKKFTRELNN